MIVIALDQKIPQDLSKTEKCLLQSHASHIFILRKECLTNVSLMSQTRLRFVKSTVKSCNN